MRCRQQLIGCAYALLIPITTVNAQILSVDFQNSDGVSALGITQAGFVSFDNTHAAGGSGATSYGQFNVALTGMDVLVEGVFNRGGVTNGGSLTFADVYNDFAFKNGSTPQSLNLTLAGSGIRPNTDYDLTFYSYDSLSTQGTHSVAFTGSSGTTGAAGPLAWTGGVNPTTDGQYAATGTFTSNGSGVLTVDLDDTFSGATESTGIRLNAVQIDGPDAPIVGAPILRVDFDDGAPGTGPTETGFENYAEVGSPGTRSFTTTAGTLDVTVSGHQTGLVGGFFDRGTPADSGGFTLGELYRDFIFHNNGGTITVEIDGLEADTDYEITWYVYDSADTSTILGTISPDDAGNTFGDTLTTFYDNAISLLLDDQFAFTGIWSSTDTSLEFDVTSDSLVRINGFEIRPVLSNTVVPEPTSIAMWSILGLMLAGFGYFRPHRKES